MTSLPSSRTKAGAAWQFFVGLVLCAAAVFLVYYVGHAAPHANSVYLRELFVVLHDYGGKWVCAGLLSLLGLGFCHAAVRRLWSPSPDEPTFVQGMMRLESAAWTKQGDRD
ncbi:MAG TPA: hypothetical protein VFB96_00060 [Pirellulaceae bacterium]|nr:hypothetical protein [Pirellulaceae bacterium]